MANTHQKPSIYAALSQADSVQIDDHFIRNFYYDESLIVDEHEDGVVLEATSIDEDLGRYEFIFTKADLDTFEFDPETSTWSGQANNEDYKIQFFSVKSINPTLDATEIELNEIQKAAIRGYAGGDHAWLAEKGTITEEDINIFNDGVLPFLIKEMGPENHCENPEQAIERLQNVLEDICGAVNTLTLLQDKTEAAE